eukprot:TRINITY_DN29818_c0_g1_i1.p1 TRINITY_DN29818_c0_g1~~TRINITY_DN29818_c0_g1_i1.p1  ORF type:complete len:161 (+),score=61.11 TRINITY_DN29818_c0_g1_i1:64-546(+)
MTELGANTITKKVKEDAQKECKNLLENHYYPAWDCGVGEARTETRANPQTGQPETHSKLFYLYHPTATLVWNGHRLPASNADNLVEKMMAIRTKHTLKVLDVQPVTDDSHYLLTATGHCRYDNEITRSFSQTMLVWKETNGASRRHWIMMDNFRWTKADV